MSDEKHLIYKIAEDYLDHKKRPIAGSLFWGHVEVTHNLAVASKAARTQYLILLNSIAECARCLGVAQAKNDQGAIDHWQSELDKLLEKNIH